MTPPNALSHTGITVVLVEPQEGGNIGSVARAMKNMGLRRLRIVGHRSLINEECRRFAGKAIDVLEAAHWYSSLQEAVEDIGILVGTTSARGRLDDRCVPARGIAGELVQRSRDNLVGIVFGRERSGLTDDELALCQDLISIPADPEYPTLNLSKAVMIVAYEIFMAQAAAAGWESRPSEQPVAPQSDRDAMFAHMEAVLVDFGFLSAGHPGPIMKTLRRVLDRPHLNPREVQVIRGIFRQMRWYIEEGYRLGPERVRKP